MSKELYFTDGNNEVKYLDTTASFNLAITQDGSAFDLTNATAIDVKVANDTGYVFDKPIDMATIKQPLAGLITMPVDAEVMNALVPDDYTIEVWVTLSSLITPGSQEGLTDGATTSITTSSTGTTTYNAIFPSDDPQGFTITENVMSDSGDVIPVMSLDDFQQEFDQLKTDLTNKVSTLKGPKGDPGQGLEIKGKVDTTSQLPATASEGDGYLVNEELYVWTNGAWKDCGSIQGPQGIQGKTGIGVSSTTIQYQISNSATTTPTGTWSNTLIATTQVNPFLWTQVTLNYDDGTSKSFYLVSSKGDKGDTGAKGQSVWSFPFDIGANVTGRWWSDLKPTPTTDNPPRVGDTIVDLIGNVYQITNVAVGTVGGGGTFDYGGLLTSIKGPKGDTGPVGAGLVVKGTVSNASQLPTTGNQEGYCYFVGTDLYVFDAGAWKNCGNVSPDLSNYVTVTDLNNGLSSKANTADLSTGLATKADDSKVVHTADMRKPANDVAGIEEVSTLQTQVDNSAVGTNLLIDTETETGAMWVTPGNNQSAEKLNGCNVETDSGDWTSARYSFDDLKKRNVINTTDDFVFSAMIRVDPTLKDNPAYIKFLSTVTDKDYKTIGFIKDYADGYWHQISIVFKFLTTPTAVAYSQSLRFELGNSNGATVYWTQRKLEKGSVATDWCPNPEDKVNVSDMRKPASDVAGIEEVNAKQDKIGYTPADDSKVVHNTGTEEVSGQKTFDTAPIDKTTGNPYITKDGVPAVPSTLADTTKLSNFTAGLQSNGTSVATKSDVTTAISTATANMVDSSKPTNFTAGLQVKGVDVATNSDTGWQLLVSKDSSSAAFSSDSYYRIVNGILYVHGTISVLKTTNYHYQLWDIPTGWSIANKAGTQVIYPDSTTYNNYVQLLAGDGSSYNGGLLVYEDKTGYSTDFRFVTPVDKV